jgi:hypothetical protein
VLEVEVGVRRGGAVPVVLVVTAVPVDSFAAVKARDGVD